jgi:2,4-dienoyl-CoA reductase-like NADH-dependent reductase (Old Yellow Enzyme family)
MTLLPRIERYLRTSAMPATRFGRETLGDPRFVFDLRAGREPRRETERRVVSWLDARELQEGGR